MAEELKPVGFCVICGGFTGEDAYATCDSDECIRAALRKMGSMIGDHWRRFDERCSRLARLRELEAPAFVIANECGLVARRA